MTATTVSQLEEISFVNIISFSEQRLQRNFDILARVIESTCARLDSLEHRITRTEHSSAETNHAVQKNQLEMKGVVRQLSQLKQQHYQTNDRVQNTLTTLKDQILDKGQLDIEYGGKIDQVGEHARSLGRSFKEEISEMEKRLLQQMEAIRRDQATQKDQMFIRIQNLSNSRDLDPQTPVARSSLAEIQPLSQSNPPAPRAPRTSKFPAQLVEQQLRKSKEELQRINCILQRHGFNQMASFKATLDRIAKQSKDMKTSVEEIKQRKGVEMVTDKLRILSTENFAIEQKIGLFEDKFNTVQKKLDYHTRCLSEVNNLVRQNNFLRIETLISERNAEMNNLLKDIRKQLQLKATIKQMGAFDKRTSEKFKEVVQNLTTKSERHQVKKALQFLQAKMKQIILVILKEEESEKQALLSKKSIKCASCDKQTQKSPSTVGDSKAWNMLPNRSAVQMDKIGKCGLSRFGTVFKETRKIESSKGTVHNPPNS